MPRGAGAARAGRAVVQRDRCGNGAANRHCHVASGPRPAEACCLADRNVQRRGGGTMTCQQYQELITLEFDGELDARGTLEVERHLAACEPCAQVQQNLTALRSVIQDVPLYQKAPASLRERVTESLGFEDQVARRWRISP